MIKAASYMLVANLFSCSSFAGQPDPDCVDWFMKGKVKAGSKNCEIECATMSTDMGTFMCPEQCDDLCKPKNTPSIASKFIYYPGVTTAEKELIVKRPKDAITVYKQKNLLKVLRAVTFQIRV